MSHPFVPASRMLIWSFFIGLGLSLGGLLIVFLAGAGGNPDSLGGTLAGHIGGTFSVYHVWTWASIVPLDRWLKPPRGPRLDTLLVVGIPAADWACLVFVSWWVTAKCRALRSARKPQAGSCANCGYDLRGLPEPRCPECGASIPEEQNRKLAAIQAGAKCVPNNAEEHDRGDGKRA